MKAASLHSRAAASPPAGAHHFGGTPKYSALHLTRPPARVIALTGYRMIETLQLRLLRPGQVYDNLSDRN